MIRYGPMTTIAVRGDAVGGSALLRRDDRSALPRLQPLGRAAR
jgi:hypothetical protein